MSLPVQISLSSIYAFIHILETDSSTSYIIRTSIQKGLQSEAQTFVHSEQSKDSTVTYQRE